MFPGESVAAAGHAFGEAVFTTAMSRLPGDGHRPELRRADRLLHGADGRQLRRRRRALAVEPHPRDGGRDARGARPGVDGLAPRARHRRADRHRHPLARPAPARAGRDARRSGGRREPSTRRSTAVRAQPSMAGAALVAAVSPPEPYIFADGGRVASPSSTTAIKRSILRLVAGAGAASTVLPARRRRRHARRVRRRAARRTAPAIPRRSTARSRPSASCSADARCSASASATSCSRSPPATRPSSCRSATAARTIRCSSTRTGRVLVTSQNHGFAVAPSDGPETTHTSLYDGTVEGLVVPGAARAVVAVPPRGRARARTTAASIIESGSRS